MAPTFSLILSLLLAQDSPPKPTPGRGVILDFAMAVSPEMMDDAILLHHGKLHPESKDPKIAYDRLAHVGFFDYTISDTSNAVFHYRATYEVHGFSGWEATVQSEDSDHHLITSDMERFTFTPSQPLAPPTHPAYPLPAKIVHATGKVVVDVVVGTDGKVESTMPRQGSPLFLAKAAADYAMQYRFKPATLNGEPRKDRFTLDLNFNLQSEQGAGAASAPAASDPTTLLTKEDSSEAYARAIQAWKENDLKLAAALFDGIEKRNPAYKMVQFYLGLMDLNRGLMSSGKARLARVLEASNRSLPITQQPDEVQQSAIVLMYMKKQGL